MVTGMSAKKALRLGFKSDLRRGLYVVYVVTQRGKRTLFIVHIERPITF